MVRINTESKIFDQRVGLKIKELRQSMGLSRKQLGEKIGVSQQQVAKYEWGKNRIHGSRIASIATVLHSTVGYFMDEDENAIVPLGEHHRMAIEISRNFMQIKVPAHRIALHTMVKNLMSD